MIPQIPEPITFNPLKHHFQFLAEQINLWQNQEWNEIEKELLKLGNNLLDLYTGELSLRAICDETIEILAELNLLEKDTFTNWVNSELYKKIQLSDHSVWVIKLGESPERFVHIHPGKNSISTIRVRATTLKTAIALKLQQQIYNDSEISLDLVNKIRMERLSLSPIKQLHSGKGIQKIWCLFNQK